MCIYNVFLVVFILLYGPQSAALCTNPKIIRYPSIYPPYYTLTPLSPLPYADVYLSFPLVDVFLHLSLYDITVI